MMPERRRLQAMLLLVGAAQGCASPPPQADVLPLFDGTRPFRILHEDTTLGLVPRQAESRLLAGWRPWLEGDRLVMGGDPRRALVQVVTLEPRRRRLRLELLTEPAAPSTVVAEYEGRVVGRGESAGGAVEIELPESLPAGVQTLTLRCLGEPPPPLDVVGATVEPALAAGSVAVRNGDLIQWGGVLVEIFALVSGGGVLETRLRPPDGAQAGQSFAVTASTMDGTPLGSYRWRAGEGRPKAIEIPLPETSDAEGTSLMRFRFASVGAGPAGRWLAPRLRPKRSPRGGGQQDAGSEGRRPAKGAVAPRLVVLYVMDSLRADSFESSSSSSAGHRELRRLAAEGLELRRHRSLAPSTLPSTRVLLAGSLQPSAKEGAVTYLGEAFREAGYRTGLFSGNPYVSRELGLDRGFEVAPSSTHYDVHANRSRFNDNAAIVQAAALEWLDSLSPGSKVFLYVHVMNPHNPYAPPAEIRRRFVTGAAASSLDGSTETLLGIRDGTIDVSEADETRLRQLYAAGVDYAGIELRDFLDHLCTRFEPRETLLVLTSDHGEELFEHDGVLHGHTLYEELLRIPLVVWWPGRVVPRAWERPTTTLDLRRSLLDLVAAEDRGPLQGFSLLPLWLDERDDRSWGDRLTMAAAPEVRGGMLAVRQGPWKLVFAGASRTGWGMGQGRGRTWEAEYLFHLGRDPHEQTNLIGAGDPWEDWLRSRLDAWRATLAASGTAEEEPSEALRRRLETLGYLR